MAADRTNWALSSEPWRILGDVLRKENLSWSKAPFQRAASTSIPPSPGVYLVCATAAAPLALLNPTPMNILYVGQAGISIRQRFTDHLSSSATTKMKKAREVFGNNLHFCWAVTDRFKEIELMIYQAFGPPVNDISPPRVTALLGAPRPIRLPTQKVQETIAGGIR